MLNSTTTTTLNRAPRSLRARAAAAVVAGVCATVALSGAAVAAEGGSSQADLSAAHPVTETTEGQHAAASGDKADKARGADEAATADEGSAAEDWVSPISGAYELSATFGNSGDRWTSKHSGQDFAVPTGTEVVAVHGGTVVKAGGNGAGDGPAYGNAVVVEHGDGTFTQYAHLSEVEVAVGDEVSTGEVIALSGNTGNSSGPHLHFEVRTTADYGSAIDPMKFLRGEHDADV